MSKKKKSVKEKTAPWERPNPRTRAGAASKKLTAEEKASAKASARRAGRPYPNLVDNLRQARKKTTRRRGS